MQILGEKCLVSGRHKAALIGYLLDIDEDFRRDFPTAGLGILGGEVDSRRGPRMEDFAADPAGEELMEFRLHPAAEEWIAARQDCPEDLRWFLLRRLSMRPAPEKSARIRISWIGRRRERAPGGWLVQALAPEGSLCWDERLGRYYLWEDTPRDGQWRPRTPFWHAGKITMRRIAKRLAKMGLPPGTVLRAMDASGEEIAELRAKK